MEVLSELSPASGRVALSSAVNAPHISPEEIGAKFSTILRGIFDPFGNRTDEDVEWLWNRTKEYINETTFGPNIEDPGQYIQNRPAIKAFFYCIYILIFVVGILGNALVCYVVIRNKNMQTVTNLFITNLALSDILLCTFAVPFTPLYLLTFGKWVSIIFPSLIDVVYIEGQYHQLVIEMRGYKYFLCSSLGNNWSLLVIMCSDVLFLI